MGKTSSYFTARATCRQKLSSPAAVAAELVEGSTEVLRQGRDKLDRLSIRQRGRQSLRVEREAGNQRPLFFTGGGAVVALEG
jgi:hypothetical protein